MFTPKGGHCRGAITCRVGFRSVLTGAFRCAPARSSRAASTISTCRARFVIDQPYGCSKSVAQAFRASASDKIRRTASHNPYERSGKTGVYAVW